MNYTITFNPALDYVVQVEDAKLGQLNRIQKEDYIIGGKGINISVLLNSLGVRSIATGFSAGFTGEYLKAELTKQSISHHFIEVEGVTRINMKLKSDQETEFNGAGPRIKAQDFARLYCYLEERLSEEDNVFLAGNMAPGMSAEYYVQIAALCQGKRSKFILDTNRDLLTACLVHRPFIIKPNRDELSEIFDLAIESIEQVIRYAKELQNRGARNVLVSLGGEGAVLVSEEGKIYRSGTPKGKVINSVGAGDSMLAGFMAEFEHSQSYEKSLRQGAAAGSATAFSVGIANGEMIHQLINEVEVSQLKEEK